MSVINISDLDATEKFRELNQKVRQAHTNAVASKTIHDPKKFFSRTFFVLNKQHVMYFTAVWCPPCKAIKPVYEEMSKKYEGVSFGKIDVDENSDAAQEFQISAVPTFIFSNGERFSGADPNQLESLIKALDDMKG